MGSVKWSRLYLGVICSGLSEGLRSDLRNNKVLCAKTWPWLRLNASHGARLLILYSGNSVASMNDAPRAGRDIAHNQSVNSSTDRAAAAAQWLAYYTWITAAKVHVKQKRYESFFRHRSMISISKLTYICKCLVDAVVSEETHAQQ